MMENLGNRIFKFRAWLKPSKQMARVTGIDFEHSGTFRVLTPDSQIIWFGQVNISAVLMQFTGLLDKNGKEIYEGDVIKVTGEFAIDDSGIIKWSQQEDDYTYHCGFMVDWQEEVKRRSHLSFWANHREIEIIGNIYENPELLEGAK